MAGTWTTLAAPGKVNLFFETSGRRADGYHEVVTVMQKISLADRIRVRRSRELRLHGDLAELGEKNLVAKAVRAVQERCGRRFGLEVVLEKRIPPGAGLGGGSSDAACAIRAMDRFWRLGLGSAGMMDAAARVGSDVPFFVADHGTALGTGRGERVAAVVAKRRLWFALVQPEFPLGTARVYAALRGSLTVSGKDVIPLLRALARGSVREIRRALFNRLETPAGELAPALSRLRSELERAGFPNPRMTGSGSCLYAVCGSREEAQELVQRWAAAGRKERLWVAHSLE